MERKIPEMPQFSGLEDRVGRLEQWRNIQDIENVRIQERRANADDRFDRVEKRLDKIDSHVGRIVWLLVISILSAFMAFVIRGGLVG